MVSVLHLLLVTVFFSSLNKDRNFYGTFLKANQFMNKVIKSTLVQI